jgi:hypothetical protein
VSRNRDERESFIGRWSRRKLGPEHERADAPTAAPSQDEAGAAQGDAFADFDFATLDFASDYRRFMDAAVPDHLRTKALRRLWSSSEVIAQPDELDEFLEDFRDEAKAPSADMIRSAYRIGRGFVDEAASAETAVGEPATETEASEPRPDDARLADASRDKATASSGSRDADGIVAPATTQSSEDQG